MISEKPDRIIKDPVHGYISVPRGLCDAFVDSEIFQRLRNVEQTSMRCLFPGGRHDRFVHSLGVFHLAGRFIDAIRANTVDEEIRKELEDGELQRTFEIAALMHDCGHSPFSHTFEELYNSYFDGASHDGAYDALKTVVDEDTWEDLCAAKDSAKPPASHEVMSAYVLLSEFKDALSKCEIHCPSLAARMITGCVHSNQKSVRDQLENILIRLLNGYPIDVDKLDYIVRDTWASGVNNSSIDIQRLISGAKITRVLEGASRIEFVFMPRSLGVIQTVIDARNHLYDWIYGHRVVVYYAEVLRRAVYGLGVALGNAGASDPVQNSPREIIRRMFSKETFSAGVCAVVGLKYSEVRLLSDGDLVFLLKEFCSENKWWKIYSSHTPGHVPIWKTGAEYRAIIDKPYRISMDNCAEAIRLKFHLSEDDCFACKDMAYKLQQISGDAVWIEMANGKMRALSQLVSLPKYDKVDGAVDNAAFYVYIACEYEDLKNDIIDFINCLAKKEEVEQTALIQKMRSEVGEQRAVTECPKENIVG